MIIEERLSTYINSLDCGNPPFLTELEEESHRNYVPVIRRETQNLLKLLLAMNHPKRILEVGTAVGFSALLMEYYNPADCKITTIENYAKRIPIARENFRRAGKENVIQLLEGDAAKVMRDRTVSSCYSKMRFQNITILQHVVRNQYTAWPQKAQCFWKEMDVLSFCRVHEDKIIFFRQFWLI